MAGDWIKMRVDLASDPAVIGIADSLECSEFEVVGMLHHFWSWIDAQSRDGHAAGVTKRWIDRYVQRVGFADQLEKSGWLEEKDGGISVPNFDKHNGQSAKKRAVDGKRQKNHRDNSSRETSRSERDKSVTREEKRREEIDKEPPCIPPTENQKSEKVKRKTKIPDPFMLTSEMRAWAAESAPAVDIRTETENFVDYWRGAGGTKLDWVATWRTWMRKSQQQSQQRPRGGYSGAPVNRQQQIEDANAKVLQEIIDLENQRQAGGQQSVIDLGQPITIEGEVI